MAIIKCSECGKKISDKAKQCINCGVSIGIIEEEKTIQTTIKSKEQFNFTSSVLFVISGLAFILGTVSLFFAIFVIRTIPGLVHNSKIAIPSLIIWYICAKKSKAIRNSLKPKGQDRPMSKPKTLLPWIRNNIVASILVGIAVIGSVTIVVTPINLEGNITNIDYLKFILPSEFEDVSSDDIRNYSRRMYYIYSSSTGNCQLTIDIDDDNSWRTDETVEEWYIREVGEYTLGEQIINKNNWKTRHNENGSVYVAKYKGTVYKVMFTFGGVDHIDYDSSSYCYKAHNTVVNSLEFK